MNKRIEIATKFLTKQNTTSSIIIDNDLEALMQELPDEAVIFFDDYASDKIKQHFKPYLERFTSIHYWEHRVNELSLDAVSALCKDFADLRISKETPVCVIGTKKFIESFGFACSLYLNGVTTYIIPTTLYGMTTTVGGKYMLDASSKTKRDIEIITHPYRVLICPAVAQIGSNSLFKSGLANMIKLGMIDNLALIDKLNMNIHFNFDKRDISDDLLMDLIDDAVRTKITLIANLGEPHADQFLEFGFTFAKILEIVSPEPYSYGDSLSYGLFIATAFSKACKDSKITTLQYNKIERLLQACYPNLVNDINLYREKVINYVESIPSNGMDVNVLTKLGRLPHKEWFTKARIFEVLNNAFITNF